MSNSDNLTYDDCQRMQREASAGGNALVSIVFVAVWVIVVGYVCFR